MKEIRTCELHIETRADDSADMIITGTPIVFEQPTTIKTPFGDYTEIVRAAALDGVALADVRLLYNHDSNRVPLARTPKTMTLSADSAGLHMRATLPNTEEARAVYAAITRGDLSGMSFGFTVDDDFYNADTNTREIRKINKLYEVSVVPYPAYEATEVSAEARSNIESMRDPRRDAARILINQILMEVN